MALVHACPPEGSGIMPCCGRTPFEVALTDCVTLDMKRVTCVSAPHCAGRSAVAHERTRMTPVNAGGWLCLVCGEADFGGPAGGDHGA